MAGEGFRCVGEEEIFERSHVQAGSFQAAAEVASEGGGNKVISD